MKIFRKLTSFYHSSANLPLSAGHQQQSYLVPLDQAWANPRLRLNRYCTATALTMENLKAEAPKISVPGPPIKLSSVVLRYREGDERFQVSLTIKTRKFNFDRSIKEATSTFLERVKVNMSKKLKNFEPETTPISFLVGTDEYSASSLEPFPVSDILVAAGKGPTAVMFRLGEEETTVNVNPPEITHIKFWNQCLVGFPMLPIKTEGSSNFQYNSSTFLWESRPGDDMFPGIPAKPRPRKPSKEVWTRRNPGQLAFTPSDADINSYLRFTCTPSLDGIVFGEPVTVELTPAITLPPVDNFLFKERLKIMTPMSKDSSTDFRLISYNALSELLTTPEWFKASPKDALESDYRLQLLITELKAYQGDILCIQEIEQKHFERYFSPFLSAECGLQGVLSLKSGEDAYEGLATFYNPSKFNLVETRTVTIRDHMQTLPFYSSLSSVPGLIERLHERNTVLQVTVFDHIASGQRIFVANTHLYFKPDADHIRLLQTITSLAYLQQELERAKENNPKHKISLLFCGDFNCTPPYASYRLATSGKVTENDSDWTSHETEKISGISFQHNLSLATAFPSEELTTIVINFEGCIDYIFYQPLSLRLLERYSPPSKAQIATLVDIPEDKLSLPNFQAPSDHLPIIADFSVDI